MNNKETEKVWKASEFLEELVEAKKNGMRIYFIQDGSMLQTIPLFDKELSNYKMDERYKDRNPNPSSNKIHEYCFIRRKE